MVINSPEVQKCYSLGQSTMQLRQIPLHRHLMANRLRRSRKLPVPRPRRLVLGDFVQHNHLLDARQLEHLAGVVLLRCATIVARRQPQLETDATLHGATLATRLQLEPSVHAGRWNVGNREVYATEEIVLAALSRRLGNLLEETTESAHSAHLIQAGHGVQHAALVVMVPDVQVECVRVDVVDVAARSNVLV